MPTINRRRFVALLSSLPLIGKAMLAVSVKRKIKPPLPSGYIQCEVCSEFYGTTDASNRFANVVSSSLIAQPLYSETDCWI